MRGEWYKCMGKSIVVVVVSICTACWPVFSSWFTLIMYFFPFGYDFVVWVWLCWCDFLCILFVINFFFIPYNQVYAFTKDD